jgi:hypothetical protein
MPVDPANRRACLSLVMNLVGYYGYPVGKGSAGDNSFIYDGIIEMWPEGKGLTILSMALQQGRHIQQGKVTESPHGQAQDEKHKSWIKTPKDLDGFRRTEQVPGGKQRQLGGQTCFTAPVRRACAGQHTACVSHIFPPCSSFYQGYRPLDRGEGGAEGCSGDSISGAYRSAPDAIAELVR